MSTLNNQIRQQLKSKLDLKNIFEFTKIKKITLNIGVGEGKDDSKFIDKALDDLTLI